MRADWRQAAKHLGWRVDGNGCWVPVGNRQHRVSVEEDGGTASGVLAQRAEQMVGAAKVVGDAGRPLDGSAL